VTGTATLKLCICVFCKILKINSGCLPT
jgi:hypothetical protein